MPLKGTYKTITDIKQIQQLRKRIGWDTRTTKQWKKALQSSSWMYSLWENDQLIAMGRAVSDGVFCMIYDVIVHPEFQNQGLGKQLVRALLKKASRGLKVGIFVENKTSLFQFYTTLGFEPIHGMQLVKK